jgi:hypothetical protein
MNLCILTGGKLITVAATAFTLQWTHSIEKTEWREAWSLGPAGLVLTQAWIKGSGAGMEPGDDAVLKDGWWSWRPKRTPVARLSLAASGKTVSGWTLCHDGGCLPLGTKAGDDAVVGLCPLR